MIFYSLLVLFFFFYIFDKDGDDGKKKQSLLARGNATMRVSPSFLSSKRVRCFAEVHKKILLGFHINLNLYSITPQP